MAGHADTAFCAADPDILVRPSKAAHNMAFEMGKNDHGTIIQKRLSHRHLPEPLPPQGWQKYVSPVLYAVFQVCIP